MQGPAFGAVLWVLLISAAAFSVAFTLSWRPALLLPVARCLQRQPAA
ncbi:MAG: DUF3325 family protein [Rhizobacter sp.]